MRKIILSIAILALLIITACTHTGKAVQSKDLSAEDIRPNYAKPYAGCSHTETRCKANIMEECRGGYWHTSKICQYGCDNNICNPSPNVRSNPRVPGTRGGNY